MENKQSVFYSPVTRTRHVTKTSDNLSEYMDDKHALNKQVVAFNPNKEWLVPKHVKISNFTDVFNVVNGENFSGEVDFYTLPLGVFTSIEQVAKGLIPVNHKLIGDTDELVINSSPTTYSIGTYKPLSFVNDMGKYYMRAADFTPQFDSNIITTPENNVVLSNAIISELHQFSDVDIVRDINLGRKAKYPVYLTSCYNAKTNENITLASYTPIYFANDKIKEAADFPVTFSKKNKDNRNTIQYFHPIPTSKVWIFNVAIPTETLVSAEAAVNSILNIQTDGLVITNRDKEKFQIVNGHGLVPMVDRVNNPTTNKEMSVVNAFAQYEWMKHYTVFGCFVYNFDIHKYVTRQWFNRLKATRPEELENLSTNGYFFKMVDGFQKVTLPTEVAKFFEQFYNYNFSDNLYAFPVPSIHSVYDNVNDQSYPYDEVATRLHTIGKLNTSVFTQDDDNPLQVFARYVGDTITSNVTPQLFEEIIPRNSILYGNKSENKVPRTWYLAYRPSLQTNAFANTTGQKFSFVLESQILSTIEAYYPVPFFRQVDDYIRYTFDRKYNITDNPVVIQTKVTDNHYTQVRSISDDIILSDDLDKLIGLDQIPDDYFTSKIIDTSKDKINAFNDIIQSQPTVDDIVNKVVESIDVQSNKDPNSPVNPVDSHNIKEAISGAISKNMENSTNALMNSQLTEDMVTKYSQFKMAMMASTTEESKTAVIGHLRILNTNFDESPLYAMLTGDLEIEDDAIKVYSQMMLEEYSSMLKTDAKSLVDSIDIINEVNLINSIVSSQTKELENSFNEFKGYLSDKKEQSKQDIQNIHAKINELFNNAQNIASNITQSANSYLEQAEQMKKEFPNSYDSLLFTRNVTKTTGYLSEFTKALLSDPYLALKQHASYLRSRLTKASTKVTIIEGMIKAMDFIPKIPNLIIDGIGAVGKLIGNIALFALSTAMEAITIIDNVDKLMFISEQYISKGIVSYSTIPTVYDDMFTPPDVHPIVYSGIKRKAEVKLDINTMISSHVKDQLLNTIKEPIVIGDKAYSYNNYDVDDVLGNMSGFYYPINNDSGLPIIKPISSSKTLLLPDLTDFVPEYPQRGSMWKLFLKQLSYDKQMLTKVDSLSPFIPLTPEILAVYSATILGAGVVAASGAIVAAGIRGDWLGAMVGAVMASTAVIGANTKELVNIVGRRGLIGGDDVYSYFSDYYNDIKDNWSNKINSSFINDNYIFVSAEDDIPLFSDASDIKKFFLKIKEILILTTQLVGIAAVGFMLGKISSKINMKRQNKKKLKALKNRHKRDRIALKDQANERISKIDDDISKVNSDPNLSDKEKEERVKQLEKDKKNVNKWLKGEQNLYPTNKAGLQNILAANWGVTPLATSPSGKSIVSSLSSLGPMTSNAISDFSKQVDKFEKTPIGQEVSQEDANINSSESNGLGGLLESGSSLIKLLTSVKEDTDTTKKFI